MLFPVLKFNLSLFAVRLQFLRVLQDINVLNYD